MKTTTPKSSPESIVPAVHLEFIQNHLQNPTASGLESFEQYHRSLAKGLWQKSYAGSNPDEFFAELTMWYFGTHGDLHMTGPKPANGPDGLKHYDPEAFALLDEFYSGRMKIPEVKPARRRRAAHEASPNVDAPAKHPGSPKRDSN